MHDGPDSMNPARRNASSQLIELSCSMRGRMVLTMSMTALIVLNEPMFQSSGVVVDVARRHWR